jgi:hypothetical protein
VISLPALRHFQESGFRFSVGEFGMKTCDMEKCDMQKSDLQEIHGLRGRALLLSRKSARFSPRRRPESAAGRIGGTACGVSSLTSARRSGHLGTRMAAGES